MLKMYVDADDVTAEPAVKSIEKFDCIARLKAARVETLLETDEDFGESHVGLLVSDSHRAAVFFHTAFLNAEMCATVGLKILQVICP